MENLKEHLRPRIYNKIIPLVKPALLLQVFYGVRIKNNIVVNNFRLDIIRELNGKS